MDEQILGEITSERNTGGYLSRQIKRYQAVFCSFNGFRRDLSWCLQKNKSGENKTQ